MGSKKNVELFSGLTGEASGAEQVSDRKRKMSYLEGRDNTLAKVAAGDMVNKSQLRVDPARCRMWAGHNRAYELLNEKRCEDLIEGFLAQGKQEFPAIVRRVKDDPNFDYEVICGARRHWTVSWLRQNNYPQFKFLIEVQDLSDEEAFRLGDTENRDKEDISDYERALDYQRALKLYYRAQKEMAERMKVKEAWLGQYLSLAKLPKEIVSAYADITHIRVRHARDLKPFLREAGARARVLQKAKELGELQRKNKEEGRRVLEGQAVVTALKSSAVTKTAKGVLAEYKSAQGNDMMTVSRQGRSGLMLRILPNNGASKKELLEACERALNEFLS